MGVENWRIRQGMRSFNTNWGKEKDGGVIDWAEWAEQNDGSKARWVARQQATRWFSRQNHEALGSTRNQEVGRKWGRGEVQKGDKAKAGGWLKEQWVSLMPYNMYIPFLLSPPIPQRTLPTRTLKYPLRMTQDSKQQADRRTVRERRAQNRWSETPHVQWWDPWTPSLSCFQNAGSQLSWIILLWGNLRPQRDSLQIMPSVTCLISPLITWQCRSPVSRASPPSTSPQSSLQHALLALMRTDSKGHRTQSKASYLKEIGQDKHQEKRSQRKMRNWKAWRKSWNIFERITRKKEQILYL